MNPVHVFVGSFALAACGPGVGERPCSVDDAPILAIGDSILTFHAGDCASIVDVASERLGRPVRNAAKSGARVTAGALYAFGEITARYESGSWDWVIVEGGVNDLRGHCDRERGDEIVDELASPDGAGGEVAQLVDRALDDGAMVALVGYYPLFDDASFGFGRCNPELDELRVRYAAIASARDDVVFVDPGDVVSPDGTPEAYREDGVHPTEVGSERVGQLLADAMLAHEGG